MREQGVPRVLVVRQLPARRPDVVGPTGLQVDEFAVDPVVGNRHAGPGDAVVVQHRRPVLGGVAGHPHVVLGEGGDGVGPQRGGVRHGHEVPRLAVPVLHHGLRVRLLGRPPGLARSGHLAVDDDEPADRPHVVRGPCRHVQQSGAGEPLALRRRCVDHPPLGAVPVLGEEGPPRLLVLADHPGVVLGHGADLADLAGAVGEGRHRQPAPGPLTVVAGQQQRRPGPGPALLADPHSVGPGGVAVHPGDAGERGVAHPRQVRGQPPCVGVCRGGRDGDHGQGQGRDGGRRACACSTHAGFSRCVLGVRRLHSFSMRWWGRDVAASGDFRRPIRRSGPQPGGRADALEG